MKLKKGDYVVGRKGCQGDYGYFGEFCVAEVVEVDEDDGQVLVEIISDEIDSDNIGESEWVEGSDVVLKDTSTSGSASSTMSQTLNLLPGTKIEYNDSKTKLFKAKGLI